MSLPQRLDAALRRLSAALDQVEAAGERHLQAASHRADLAEELAVMQDDRSRLAVELDGAVARAQRLDAANRDVSRRLDQTAETIRTVLASGQQD